MLQSLIGDPVPFIVTQPNTSGAPNDKQRSVTKCQIKIKNVEVLFDLNIVSHPHYFNLICSSSENHPRTQIHGNRRFRSKVDMRSNRST